MAKIKYTCSKCSWTTSIIEEWADVKPKRCMNKRCNTSFLKDPEALITELPQKVEVESNVKPKRVKRNDND
jgi:hypothetical protein